MQVLELKLERGYWKPNTDYPRYAKLALSDVEDHPQKHDMLRMTITPGDQLRSDDGLIQQIKENHRKHLAGEITDPKMLAEIDANGIMFFYLKITVVEDE